MSVIGLVPAPRASEPDVEPSRLQVRRVGRDDAADLLRLCEAHAHDPAAERGRYGTPRPDAQELVEALFDPPVRAWAWIARIDDVAVGYAGATAGCAFAERGYYFRIEALYVRGSPQAADVRNLLLQQVLAMGRRLGCHHAQWLAPTDAAGAAWSEPSPVRTGLVHLVTPLES